MRISEIEGTYRKLETLPKNSGQITATVLEQASGIYAACNDLDQWLLLIRDKEIDFVPSRDLAELSVEYGVSCVAKLEDQVLRERVILIRLKGEYEHLNRPFILLVAMLIQQIKTLDHNTSPRELVSNLIELFRAKPMESREVIVGFFGELSLMARSDEPGFWVNNWHTRNASNKDFSFDDFFVEVKTTENRRRKHKISAEQLEDAEKSVWVASLRVEEDPTGSTIEQEISSLESKMTPAEFKLVAELYFDVIGINNSMARNLRLRLIDGLSEIKFFNSKIIPKPLKPGVQKLDLSISAIQFQSNFEVIEANLNSDADKSLLLDFPSFESKIASLHAATQVKGGH